MSRFPFIAPTPTASNTSVSTDAPSAFGFMAVEPPSSKPSAPHAAMRISDEDILMATQTEWHLSETTTQDQHLSASAFHQLGNVGDVILARARAQTQAQMEVEKEAQARANASAEAQRRAQAEREVAHRAGTSQSVMAGGNGVAMVTSPGMGGGLGVMGGMGMAPMGSMGMAHVGGMGMVGGLGVDGGMGDEMLAMQMAQMRQQMQLMEQTIAQQQQCLMMMQQRA